MPNLYRAECGPCSWSTWRRNALQAGIAAGRHLEANPEHRVAVAVAVRRERWALQISAGPDDLERLMGEPMEVLLFDTLEDAGPVLEYGRRHVLERRAVYLFDLENPDRPPLRVDETMTEIREEELPK